MDNTAQVTRTCIQCSYIILNITKHQNNINYYVELAPPDTKSAPLASLSLQGAIEGPLLYVVTPQSWFIPIWGSQQGARYLLSNHVEIFMHSGNASALRWNNWHQQTPMTNILPDSYYWCTIHTFFVPTPNVHKDPKQVHKKLVFFFAVGLLPNSCCPDPIGFYGTP